MVVAPCSAESTVATVGLFDSNAEYEPEQLLVDVRDDERRQYHALNNPRQAREYLASRWLLRQHLAHWLELAPVDVPLAYERHRAPTLAGMSHRLSLSHSRGLCLCAVSAPARVGCDVEHHRRRRHDVGVIASQYFHPDEAAELDRSMPESHLDDFYRLWTLKEAGHKALGQGIAGGLQKPAFSLRPMLQCEQSLDRNSWTFAACRLATPCGHYALALALGARRAAFTVWCYRPGVPREPLNARWATTSFEPDASGQPSAEMPRE